MGGAVHPSDRPQATHLHVRSQHCNTDASCQSSCQMVPDAQRQYNYTIEYRTTKQHGNADALSRLPVGPDPSFDGEEGDNDVDNVCTLRVINSQLQPHSRNQLKDATNRDPILSEVKRYVREGWPQKIDRPDVQEFKKYTASLSVTDDCIMLLLLSTHSSLLIGGSPLLLSYGGSPPASPASHLAGLLRWRDPSTNPGPIAWWVSVGN